MTCREVEEQEILERYLLDRLTDSEHDSFEQHYFECDSCFEQLQTGLAAQQEMRRALVRPKERHMFLGHMKIWIPALAALVLLITIGVWRYADRGAQSPKTANNQNGAPPSPKPSLVSPTSIEELARVEAPPYTEVVLRGPEDDAQSIFREAMKHYVKQDYTGAIPGLRKAVKADPETPDYTFYLGACYLLTDQIDPAIKSFQQVIALDHSADSEKAHFYLAKAYLRKKDLPQAKDNLEAAVKLGGSRAAEAAEILRQVGK